MSYFTNLIYQYGLFAMFVIILIEYACFPISSEIVLPFSGAVASLQHIPFLKILPLSVLAGIIGTTFCYLVGRFGGGTILDKIKLRFPKTQKGIDASYEKFNRYGAFAVCIGRVIPICRTYIAFIAGATKQNYLVFFISSLIGISVWNTLLIGLGYLLRENWSLAGIYYARYKGIVIPLILLLIIFFVIKSRRKKHQGIPT